MFGGMKNPSAKAAAFWDDHSNSELCGWACVVEQPLFGPFHSPSVAIQRFGNLSNRLCVEGFIRRMNLCGLHLPS